MDFFKSIFASEAFAQCRSNLFRSPPPRNKKKRFCRTFFYSFLAGLFVAILLIPAPHLSPVRSIKDSLSDIVINLSPFSYSAEALKEEDIAFSLIDIDENTYKSWGYPPQTPRQPLAELIKYALDGDARLVVVDIGLWHPPLSSSGGARLIEVLENHLRSPVAKTDIVLIHPGKFADKHRVNWLLKMLPTDLHSSSKLHFADAFVNASPDDLIVRRFSPGGSSYGSSSIPSVSLAVAEAINYELPKGCLANRDEPLEDIGLEQRIMFSVGWPDMASAGVSRVPAHRVLALENASYQAVEKRIVFIGSTYAESRDIYPTPVGSMPGVVILLNQTISLMGYGLIVPLSNSKGIFILASLVLLAFFSFIVACTYKNICRRIFFFGIIFIVTILPNLALVRHGIWLEAAAPILATNLHSSMDEFVMFAISKVRKLLDHRRKS